MTSFKAWRVDRKDEHIEARYETLELDDLSEGTVTIEAEYSSLNYKDALSATGNRCVTRHYHHTPGIDAAAVVAERRTKDVRDGDDVLVLSARDVLAIVTK